MPPKSRSAGPKKGARRRDKKNVPHGNAHIKSTFNNTIVSITDPTATSSAGRRRATSGSRARARAPRSRLSSRPRTPRARPRSTASRRSTCSSRDRVRVARPRSGRCRPPASRSAPSPMSPRSRTTVAVRPSGVGSSGKGKNRQWLVIPAPPQRSPVVFASTSSEATRRSSVAPTRPASTAVRGSRRANTSCSCRRSRRLASPTACSRSSSVATTRKPTVVPVRPVTSCSSSSRPAWTTSSTVPASPARVVRPGRWSATATSPSTV